MSVSIEMVFKKKKRNTRAFNEWNCLTLCRLWEIRGIITFPDDTYQGISAVLQFHFIKLYTFNGNRHQFFLSKWF